MMSNTPISQPSLPDVNAQTYPYEMVQHLLDQTASFSLFAIPDRKQAENVTLTPNNPGDFFGINGGYGLSIWSTLHRFDAIVQPTRMDTGLRVAQAIGESTGIFRSHWMFSPDDFKWAPGHEPPPVIFDPWQPRHFTMLDCELSFEGDDNFRGYGVGQTFPISVNGRSQILAAAMGNIVEGSGKFKGLEGTFALTGTITSSLGFMGSITCRVIDPYGVIRSESEIQALTPTPDVDPGATFLMFRGEKKNKNVKTTYGPPPGGNQVALVTPSLMRAAQYSHTSRGRGGLRTEMRVYQIVSDYVATVYFNLLAPPGTGQAPVPFSTKELYTFVDDYGRTIGTISADILLGESFNLKFPAAPGQAAVRFAGFGPITGGTGPFAGVQGILTVNSLIGIAPHALSLMHVLHIVDPQAKFRATAGRGL